MFTTLSKTYLLLAAAALPLLAQPAAQKVELRIRFAVAGTEAEAALRDIAPTSQSTAGTLIVLPADPPAWRGLRTIGQPVVTAGSGNEAQFLAGGTFPLPIPDGDGSVRIASQEYGVRLKFLPLISDGRVRLQFSAQVNRLDFTHARTVQGIPAPGIESRALESSLDLADGQSFALTGLITRDIQEMMARIPGAAAAPLLSALAGEDPSKVVVVVTATVVDE